MPVKIQKKGKKYEVRTPGGVKAKGTTEKKAEAQANLLQGVEHGWKPTGKPAKEHMMTPKQMMKPKGKKKK